MYGYPTTHNVIVLSLLRGRGQALWHKRAPEKQTGLPLDLQGENCKQNSWQGQNS